jgi:hypothetical protein
MERRILYALMNVEVGVYALSAFPSLSFRAELSQDHVVLPAACRYHRRGPRRPGRCVRYSCDDCTGVPESCEGSGMTADRIFFCLRSMCAQSARAALSPVLRQARSALERRFSRMCSMPLAVTVTSCADRAARHLLELGAATV